MRCCYSLFASFFRETMLVYRGSWVPYSETQSHCSEGAQDVPTPVPMAPSSMPVSGNLYAQGK